MIEIDGGFGEGGGQLLRTSLSLSCITGKAFRIFNIRKSRSKPGLMRQHLMCVLAAARISGAEVVGAELESKDLTFIPSRVKPGNYSFDIGTAGATSLVLQTVIPSLLCQREPSGVRLVGGTHVPFSPPYDYLVDVFGPAVGGLGGQLHFSVGSCGFYPKGGGSVQCRIDPVSGLKPLDARQRGRLLRIAGRAAVANLPRSIAEREVHAAVNALRTTLGNAVIFDVKVEELKSIGQGTYIFLKAEYEHAVAGFTAIGERGKPAERVGEEAARELLRHHQTGMPVDPHLADQLVLYLAMAKGTSVFATSCVTNHLMTNLETTAAFLDFAVEISGMRDGPGTVSLTPKKR